MELSLFDLHCDTAFEMYCRNEELGINNLAVSLENAKKFKQYVQIMALWTDHRLKDGEGWLQCLRMLEHLRSDPAIQRGNALLTFHCPTRGSSTPSLLLGLEDARILEDDLSRIDLLADAGVRILTPLWKGVSCIGGAHDTDVGLTPFGRLAIARAIERGMVPDISHASEASAEEIFEIASECSVPVIASHSNSYTVCPVSRNLRDGQIKRILDCGGLIGLNLYRGFISQKENVRAEDLLLHIEHFLELGACDALSFGCDMDGAELPEDLSNLSLLPTLAEQMLRRNYSESLIHSIYFENAYRFAKNRFGYICP